MSTPNLPSPPQFSSISMTRAGDVFHYRWAARRCLRLIPSNTELQLVTIESSKENTLRGEFVIDFAEYERSRTDGSENIRYFQLKHTTVRADQPFTLSGLDDTIRGFAKRYVDLSASKKLAATFHILTNRPIAASMHDGIRAVSEGSKANTSFLKTLESYTGLAGNDLRQFCKALELDDGEGNYAEQRSELQGEVAQLVAGGVDLELLDTLVSLVQDKLMPNQNQKIVREDVLRRFGITSPYELFPATAQFEPLQDSIDRDQYADIVKTVIGSAAPVLIHAEGGVGKSVLTTKIVASLPPGSFGIAYDCFGAGKYRNRSASRHRCRDALVQVVNELASNGLCMPLVPRLHDLDSHLMRTFLDRLRVAVTKVRAANPGAVVALLFDAVDNAEMAAEEFRDHCFAHMLLAEAMPEGLRLVMLCRTERRRLLRPASTVLQLGLQPFDEGESIAHLRMHFAQASESNGREFHRLTGGNPRVQANALAVGSPSVADVLLALGPTGMTVDDQISMQLATALATLKDLLPPNFQSNIDGICLGLANLPPLIPMDVLAKIANIEPAEVRSFVADLGRPLWISEDSVQFRDEPTETWFRRQFGATVEQIDAYANRLMPLAKASGYVAETLPGLLLRAERYNELIELALTDDYLPSDNPIDARNVRVFRLQFAFKAALKQKRLSDAARLALRAGEELAGDARQMALLTKNTDLISPLQTPQRVQELAFRRLLSGQWAGSENVYSAALLATVKDFHGEATSFLRSGRRFLRIYFEERRKQPALTHQLANEDILELIYATFCLHGAVEAADALIRWSPAELRFSLTLKLIDRLIDHSHFQAIDDFAATCDDDPYVIVGVADRLLAVSRLPPVHVVRRGLTMMIHKRSRIRQKEKNFGDKQISKAIISFFEAAARYQLDAREILRGLRYYRLREVPPYVAEDHREDLRQDLLRNVALTAVLQKSQIDIDRLLPADWKQKEKKYEVEQQTKKFREVFLALIPWYEVRAKVICSSLVDPTAAFAEASRLSADARKQRWRDHDRLEAEVNRIRLDVAVLGGGDVSQEEIELIASELAANEFAVGLAVRIAALRAAFRCESLIPLRQPLEKSSRESVGAALEEGPEYRADKYIDLARSILPVKRADASAYFELAVDAVSQFGDEILQRWEAVAALAARAGADSIDSSELAYRFIRCAELVGNYVAREKHFGRNDAVVIASQLCRRSALPTLARWSDRQIGRLARQLPALAEELVKSGSIPAKAVWTLTTFPWDFGFPEFSAICLERESSPATRQVMLDATVRRMRLEEVATSEYKILHAASSRLSLESEELKRTLAYAETLPVKQTDSSLVSDTAITDDGETVNWVDFFSGADLSLSTDLSKLVERFDKLPSPRLSEKFWHELFQRLPEENASTFLSSIVNAECADVYDVSNALEHFPAGWRKNPSVSGIWHPTISAMAKRFAIEYTNTYRVENFINVVGGGESTQSAIHEGIVEGLSESDRIAGAGAYFGFARVVAGYISPAEARESLAYALERFEIHLPNPFADGPWSPWLHPPETMTESFAGFIWAMLGSPFASDRWDAMHSVRFLVELDCEAELSALIGKMQEMSCGPCGGLGHTFYARHAKQFLLMSLARVALDQPRVLKPYLPTIIREALAESNGLFVQMNAAEIALRIEDAFPQSIDAGEIGRLRQIGVSKFMTLAHDDESSPAHSLFQHADAEDSFYLPMDFDRYWLNPLGRIFGLSETQINDRVRAIVSKQFEAAIEEKFIRDSRQHIWKSTRSGRKLYSRDGSYPEIDTYSFYVCFHALQIVAGELYRAMPPKRKYDGEGDVWGDWLKRHALARNDGKWLSDARQPPPLVRRKWTLTDRTKDWRWEISKEDFLEVLLAGGSVGPQLAVCGYWEEVDGQHTESVYITSAFVAPDVERSLLVSRTTAAGTRDFRNFPFARESDEPTNSPFELFAWLISTDGVYGVDSLDPHAAKLRYPNYAIAEQVLVELALEVDGEGCYRHTKGDTAPAFLAENWSANEHDGPDKSYRHGRRLLATAGGLRDACIRLGKSLAIAVTLERRVRSEYYERNNEDVSYTEPYTKVYLYAPSGKLRDAWESVDIG